MPSKMQLYLIRHGESTNNRLATQRLAYEDYIAQRSADPDLTEIGYQQAQLMADHVANGGLPEHSIQRLYVSPMWRALLTAQPLAKALGIPAIVQADIFEHGGVFTGQPHGDDLSPAPGMTRAEMAAGFPGYELADEITETGWYRGGWETMKECDVRARSVAERVTGWAEAADGDTVALVSHGTFIDRLLKALIDTPGNNAFYFYHYNTAYTRVNFLDDGRRTIHYTNQTPHLTVDAMTW